MHVSNQEKQPGIWGSDSGPGAPAQGPAGSAGPVDIAAQLAKEREARAQMRDRLRNTEALAAESHALRARMAQELERVTAERDRLRASAAENAPAAGPQAAAAVDMLPDVPTPAGASPSTTPGGARPLPPRAGDWSTRPPQPAGKRGPWRALGLLGGLAAGAAAIAWISGMLPADGGSAAVVAGASSAAASAAIAAVPSDTAASNASDVLARAASAVAASRTDALAAAGASAPETALAAAPTAAGPAASASTSAADVPSRLRAALDAEGVLAPVEIDARSGRIAVSDPAADNATRDRTDMLIRAVYAGANLPEPQIEHRWVSPTRAGRVASAATQSAPVAVAPVPTPVPVRAPAKRDAAVPVADHRKHAPEVVAAAEEPRVILPMGRVTASCKESVAGSPAQHRAGAMATCMRHSCCSSANRQTEECRAFDKSYPLACSAG
jgi:hypothetical protein